MSTNDTTGTELQTLNQRIAERIGKDLVDLIPQDQWQAMVDTEIKKFKLAVAPKIIQDLLKEAFMNHAKAAVEEFTCTNEYRELSGDYTNKALRDFIAESGGTILAGLLTPSMQMVMQDLRGRIGY